MTHSGRRVWMRFLTALFVLAAMAGCDKSFKEPTLEKTAALPKMRTHCVGRYLIDLPDEFEQMLSSDVDLIYGLDKDFREVNVKVLRTSGSPPSFDRIVSKRAMELAANARTDTPSKTRLALQRRINETVSLIRAHDSDLPNYFKAEVFAERGVAVGIFAADIFKGDVPEAIESTVLSIAEKARFLPAVEQSGRGTCLGPLLIDAGQDGERFSIAFRAASRPDAVIKIDMNSLLAKSDGGLLKRWESKAVMLKKAGFESRTIRRGSVTVGGRPGEELLLQGKEYDHLVLGFTAEPLQTKPATFALPSMAVHMNLGGQIPSAEYVDASWSESEALAIWDAIVKSVRLRPGAI
jgi:hypothetical protein